MTPKETTYQKNKRLLAEARQDIRELCLNPLSEKSTLIKFKVSVERDVERLIMAGSPTMMLDIKGDYSYDGFYGKIIDKNKL